MNAKERTRISSIAVIAIAAAGMVSEEKKQARKWKKRVAWVKPWLLKRQKHGAFEALLNGFRREDPTEFKQFLRMDSETFDELLGLVEHSICKQNTTMRDALEPRLKLAVTIRFLATGVCYTDLHLFRIHKSMLSKIIPEVCDAIYAELKDRYLKVKIYFHIFPEFVHTLLGEANGEWCCV